MLPIIRSKRKNSGLRFGLFVTIAVCATLAALCANAFAARANKAPAQKSFATPDEAAAALAAAAKAGDTRELSAVLGPGSKEVISSGDEVADRAAGERFARAYEEKHTVVREGDGRWVLEVGNGAWPLPIPIVVEAGQWRFDTKAGKQEILNRRVGKNELSAIQVCLAYVDGQREYASKDRSGDGVLQYAQKVMSAPGKKDGLYWEAGQGEEQSPMGPLVAEARAEGYTRKKPGEKPSPYHGYYYRILTAQGSNAPGGAYDYLAKGRMIGGFALVAYPAQYGSSGIMTFLVSHDGAVYQKDLGRKTATAAQAMKKFDPDKTWKKVEGKDLELPPK